jgi:tetratricopeptide (TPR) repeat protein
MPDLRESPTRESSPENARAKLFAIEIAYAVGLLVLTFAAYFPALSGDYIWTDWQNLGAGKGAATLAELGRYWTSSETEQYFPLTYSSFWLERWAWGPLPMATHAINVAFHFLNACLLARVLRRLNIPGAWLAAAVFALHPVHVESVAWMIERKNVMSGFFFLLALLFFLRSDSHSSERAYRCSIVSFALALFSKTSTVILPAALILSRIYLRRSWSFRDLTRLAPYVALSGLMSLVAVSYDHKKNPFLESVLESSFVDRLVVASFNLWFYLGKLIAPMDLAFVYEQWDINFESALVYLPTLSVLAAGAALWTFRCGGSRGPLLAFTFYMAGLFPVLGFFPFYYMLLSPAADRFQYLPSMALIALFAAACSSWPWRGARLSGRSAAIVKSSCVVGLIALLGVLTWQQCHIYEDNYSIWQDTLRKSPNARSVHRLFGQAAAVRGDIKVAKSHYRDEIKLHPEERKAYYGLAGLLKANGQLRAAEKTYIAAVRANPRFSGPRLRLGEFYEMSGRVAKAVEIYRQALEVEFLREPFKAQRRLAYALQILGSDMDAKKHQRKGIKKRR